MESITIEELLNKLEKIKNHPKYNPNMVVLHFNTYDYVCNPIANVIAIDDKDNEIVLVDNIDDSYVKDLLKDCDIV